MKDLAQIFRQYPIWIYVCLVTTLKEYVYFNNNISFPSGNFPDSCVAKCTCYSNRHQSTLVAECSESGLRHLPDSLPEQTDWLLLSENHFTSLAVNTDTTARLEYISKLDLSSNELKNISSHFLDIFMTSNNLSYLDISNNHLTSLPESLQNLSSLQTLKITGNKFKCFM